MKKVNLILAFILIASFLWAEGWEKIGPYNCRTYDVAIAPHNSAIAYVATAKGIYKTTDGGENWSRVWEGVCLTMDIFPTNSEVVCGIQVTSQGGVGVQVIRTVDGGQSWEEYELKELSPVQEIDDTAIVINPVNPNVVYAGFVTVNGLSRHLFLFETTDAGLTWREVTFEHPISEKLTHLSLHFLNGTLYGYFARNISEDNLHFLFKKVGDFWIEIGLPVEHDVEIGGEIEMDTEANRIYFAVTEDTDRLWVSSDEGVNWRRLYSGNFSRLEICGETIYLYLNWASPRGSRILISSDQGETWIKKEVLSPLRGYRGFPSYTDFRASKSTPRVFYLTTSWGLFRLNDGQRWEQVKLEEFCWPTKTFCLGPDRVISIFNYTPDYLLLSLTDKTHKNWIIRAGSSRNFPQLEVISDPANEGKYYVMRKDGVFRGWDELHILFPTLLKSCIDGKKMTIDQTGNMMAVIDGSIVYIGQKRVDNSWDWRGFIFFPEITSLLLNENFLYLGTVDGIHQMEISTGAFNQVGLAGTKVYSLKERGGEIWVATNSGLYLLENSQIYLKGFANEKVKDIAVFDSVSYVITDQGVLKKKGNDWVADGLAGEEVDYLVADENYATLYAWKKGGFIYSREVEEIVEETKPVSSLVEVPSLAAYPNPFNPECFIPVAGLKGKVKVRIYNILGQVVRELELTNAQTAKNSKIYWDGRNSCGQEVSSGVYFYEILTGHKGLGVRKAVILK
jgi:photosystem II stability/assembly factor-like uncharacterized protein